MYTCNMLGIFYAQINLTFYQKAGVNYVLYYQAMVPQRRGKDEQCKESWEYKRGVIWKLAFSVGLSE